MLAQLLGLPEHPLVTFAGLVVGGLLLFLTFASISYWYFFKFRKDRYHPTYREDKKENRRALKWSVLSIVGNAVLTTPFHLAIAYGYSEIYWDPLEHGVGWLFISAGLYLVITETAIYWIHRALHWGPLYDYIHGPHHSFRVPNSYAGVAFNPLDSFAQALPHHLAVFFFPVHIGVYLGFVTFVTLWAVMIHDRVSFVRWAGINFTGHHTLHHWYGDYNYGQFFTFWDRIGGTYKNPDDPEVQADVPEGVLSR